MRQRDMCQLIVCLAAAVALGAACSGGSAKPSATGGMGGSVASDGGSAAGGNAPNAGGSNGDASAADADASTTDPNVLARFTFDSPDDLKRLRFDEQPGQVTVQGGVLQIPAFSQRTAIVDSQPDAVPTNLFDLAAGDIVIAMKVQSNSSPVVPSPALASAVLPKVWVSFFPQAGRKQAPRVTFTFSEVGNDGFAFAPGSDLENSRTAPSMDAKASSTMAELTPIVPDERFYDFRVTLHLASPGVVRAVASALDGTRLVLRGAFDFKLEKTSGEIAFGAYADRTAPFVIDSFTVTRAPADEPVAPQMTFDTSDPVHVWIPPGVTKVKGIFISSPGCCGDSNGIWDYRSYLANFARAYDLAVVAHVTNQPVSLIEAGISQLATKSGHSELNEVPIVIYGFSAGSLWASNFTSQFTSRVVAYVADAFSRPSDVAPAARGVPGIFTIGDNNDVTPLASMRTSFEGIRQASTHQALLFKEGFAHMELGAFNLYMPFFVRALDARSPNRTLPLLPVDESKAWVIETDTLNPPDAQSRAPMAKIAPAAGYAGEIKKTGWLLDQSTAYVAAAYGSYRRAIAITPMYDAVAGETRAVKVRVLPTMNDWTKIELYDYATLVHTFAPGDTLVHEYAKLTRGVHTLSAQMTHAAKVYVSFPQTFVVTPN